jgi:hypothetical protein
MKYILFVILLVIALVTAGCVSENKNTVVAPTETTTIITTQMTPSPTILPTRAVTTTVNIEKTDSFTDVDVNRHFLSLVFGKTNFYITKRYTGPGARVAFSLDGKNTADDTQTITDFGKDYNIFTSNTAFDSPPIRTDEKGIHLEFFPPDYFKNLNEYYIIFKEIDPSNENYLFAVMYSAKSDGNHFLINSDLKGDKRKHYIMKAMLYVLGFVGTTYTYPDSFFYSNNQDHITLTPIDKAAINVMYNNQIYNGMSLTGVKTVLMSDK